MQSPVGATKKDEDFASYVSEELLGALRHLGIVAPNSMQASALPLALSGCDILVSAQTGSGKTLVFLLPIFQRLWDGRVNPVASRALVLAPTSELAQQLAAVAEAIARELAPLSNGVACILSPKQIEDRVRLIISTPDVLLHCHCQRLVSFDSVIFCAIDEADGILCPDAALAPAALQLLEGIRKRSPSCQFSLTMAHLSDEREQELLALFPGIQRVGMTGVLVPTLRQSYHYFRGDKEDKLMFVLDNATEDDDWLAAGTTLIFCEDPAAVSRVSSAIRASKPSEEVVQLCGDNLQERTQAIHAFRSGKARYMVATTVAARGLDFPLLRHVVLYDVPSDITSYVHCVGRTARCGQTGLVSCLVQTHESSTGHFGFTRHHGLPPAEQMHFARPEPDKAMSRPRRHRPDPGSAERRKDPADGRAYTLAAMRKFYRSSYTDAEIQAYWLSCRSC